MAGKIRRVPDDTSYYSYAKHPKDVSLEDYVKFYEAFCKIYRIPVTKPDIDAFSYLVNKSILKRSNPEGIDYSPKNNKARLFIAPVNNRSLRLFSYDQYGSQNVMFELEMNAYLK